MNYLLLDVSTVICVFAGVRLLKSWRRRRNAAPLPPGPKGLPLIGNLYDMPEANEWETVRKWGEKYGPVVYVKILGRQFIFLNSYQGAIDVLEKRGYNYSSRPQNTMMDLEGWTDWNAGAMPYHDQLKRQRQIMHRFLEPSAVGDYLELQVQSTHRLLKRLVIRPDNYFELTRLFVGETILMVTYGHKAADQGDPFIEIGEKGMEAFGEAEGFFLVNVVPWLRYLPSWFPGASFQKIAKVGYEYSMAMYQKPHEMLKKRMRSGSIGPSMWSKLMEANAREDGVVEDEELIAQVTGTAYGGGADTTVSALQTFLLLMVLHPEAQKRAQEELDRVVGKDNLPSFEDRANLPYVNALCKESLRWRPVGPLGAPHMATEDDEYNGYHIPAGAIMFANIWAMNRNPDMYPEPDKFIPERWLPVGGKEPPLDSRKVVFGFGRRTCPGRHLADNSIFIVAASILSAFNISKALDKSGKEIDPEIEYTPNSISHPKPFKYSLTPRSTEIVKVIHQAADFAK